MSLELLAPRSCNNKVSLYSVATKPAIACAALCSLETPTHAQRDKHKNAHSTEIGFSIKKYQD